jgi:hypothetical protein
MTGKKNLEKYIYIYINQGERKGSNLSAAFFNIYIDDHPRNWKNKLGAGILPKMKLYLNTLLFADEEVVIKDSKTNSTNLSIYQTK